MVPSLLLDPIRDSPIRIGMAHTRLAITKAMRKVPPPHSPATLGNLQMFPVPTAIPMAATIKANLLPNLSLTRELLLAIIS
jgi:hypothetical protein